MHTLHTSPARGPDHTRASAGTTERGVCCAKDLFRIAFGVIWLIDGFFTWRSGFH